MLKRMGKMIARLKTSKPSVHIKKRISAGGKKKKGR
jgi:hypothetical protein|tara:strand:- start:154 stop:261 length:108 start_codon:yes stop_codon:yes gene_type:complete